MLAKKVFYTCRKKSGAELKTPGKRAREKLARDMAAVEN